MKLLPRRSPEPDDETSVPAPSDEGDVVAGGKGRPTPKRRESVPVRGPVTAPKTRKEAYARQRELAKQAKQAKQTRRNSPAGSSAKPMTPAERRIAMRSGDPAALPRRDQGPTRKLARDFVDSRVMLSNFLLLIFLFLIVGSFIPAFSVVAPLAILLIIADCYIAGRRIRSLAIERFGTAEGGVMGIGYYAVSRAFLPRRWRLPPPQVQRGEAI